MHDIQPSDLTDKQQAFVEHYVRSLGKVGLSALKAGYSDRTAGSQLLRNPKIVEEIRRQTQQDLTLHGVTAIGITRKLMKSARSDYVKLEAAKQLISLSPFQPPDRKLIAIAGDLSVSFDIGGGGSETGE